MPFISQAITLIAEIFVRDLISYFSYFWLKVRNLVAYENRCTYSGGAVANRLRRRTSDQTVLGSNPAVAAALSPWTRLFTPIVSRRNLHISFYYRKRGSASYIVRQWLLWESERERERRLWRHWYHAEIASDHAYDYLDGATQRVDAFWLWACRALELRSAWDKELGAWALDWAAGSSDWWTTMGKWKLCVCWSDCRGSPSSISLACFKQEE